MKIMILGCRGQLGSDCRRVFEKDHTLVCLGRDQVDITDRDGVADAIAAARPEAVINCGAFTAVDLCETETHAAHTLNALAPEFIARACSDNGAVMVHLSTDYVFDGRREPPGAYTESDTPAPLSAYGRTKLEGEERVLAVSRDHMVVRTAWLYGIAGGNFLKTMLRLALTRPGQTVKVVNDQFGSPTWTLRLALQLEKLLRNGGHGIYHATAEGYCSWFELASYFLKEMKVSHAVVPCTTEEYPLPARRPANSILDNTRLKRADINRMTGWRDGVDRFIASFRQDLMEECGADR